MRSGSPRSAGAEPGREGAHAAPPRRRWFATSHVPLLGLRYGILTLLVLLVAGTGLVLFDQAQRLASTPLALLEAAEGVAQRSLNLDATRTKEGLPSLRVSAREAVTLRGGTTELRDVLVTVYGESQERTEVSAPLAVKDEGAGSGWTFRNGVEVRTEQGLVIRVPEVRYRESPQEVIADGDVEFEQGAMTGQARGLRYFPARRRLEFLAAVQVATGTPEAGFQRIRADASTVEPESGRIDFRRYRAESDAGDVLEGALLRLLFVEEAEERRLDRMEASGGFRLTGPGDANAPAIFGSAGRALSGDSMAVEIQADGKVGALVARGEVRTSLEQKGTAPRRLACERLEIDFVEGAAVALTAERQVELTLPRGAGEKPAPTSVRAHLLTTSLDPESGEARHVEASGEAVAEEEGRIFEAARIVYGEPTGRWTLHGSAAGPARARGEGIAISADRMEIARADGTLEARGRVKTVTVPRGEGKIEGVLPGEAKKPDPEKGRDTGAFFKGGGGPMHGISDSLTFRRDGREALYRGRVRLWREGESLQAEEVDLLEGSGRMEARGDVVARLPAGEQEAGAQPRIVTISAAGMTYARETGEAHFSEGARAQTADMRIEARTLTAKGGSGEGFRELTAEGSVRLQQGTRVGDCDLLVSDLTEKRVKMYGRGRLASIQDQSTQQVVKGAVLTYEEATDRILVESESGGRTWITLNPRAGKREKGDPESPR